MSQSKMCPRSTLQYLHSFQFTVVRPAGLRAPIVRPAIRTFRTTKSLLVSRASNMAESTMDVVGSGVEFMESHLKWSDRTHLCAQIAEAKTNDTVTVCGWIERHRNLGGLLFLDVRDHSGMVQVVVDDDVPEHIGNIAERVRNEWVVSVTGKVRARKDPNPNMPTGQVELVPEQVQVLNIVTKPLPFPLTQHEGEEPPREEMRLKHRVVDLRRPVVAKNLRLRHAISKSIRRFLEDEHDFIEIETPILTKSTPEGARDYLVPSRVHPGEWYALPQSPQLFKQMLMIAGYDRYYQVRT